MYMGYMKKGLQTMAMFAASGFLATLFGSMRGLEWLMAAFIILLPIIWLYQMFDSMHTLSRMKRLGIEVPEDDGFYLPQNLKSPSLFQNRTAAKILAGILLLIGISGLVFGVLDNLHHFIDWDTVHEINRVVRNNLTPAIISIVLIVLGIRLLKGGKQKADVGSDGKE
jgi:hypothetical protein